MIILNSVQTFQQCFETNTESLVEVCSGVLYKAQTCNNILKGPVYEAWHANRSTTWVDPVFTNIEHQNKDKVKYWQVNY